MDIKQKQYVCLDYSRSSYDTAIAVIRIAYNRGAIEEKGLGSLDEAVRKAALEYVKTEKGEDFFLNVLNGVFSWYDVTEIPKEIYSRYGILGITELIEDICERKDISSALVTDCDDDYLDDWDES